MNFIVCNKLIEAQLHNNYIFWIKILGYGFKIKDTSKSELLYSERNGLYKSITLGRYYIRLLTRDKKK